MGSVKDLTILKKATVTDFGEARFVFSNRFSVFDWGEMPDQIDHKGAAINILGAHFFEKLEGMGIITHYIGLIEDGQVKKLNQLKNPSNILQIKLVNVLKPQLNGDIYDYSIYKTTKGGMLIPLEIIYRNSLPPGSSVFKRLERGSITPQDLGLKNMPVANQKLSEPILDVSTKLEITDRYMTWAEAQKIAGLSNDELEKLLELTRIINKLITSEFAKIGLTNEDGKIEAGFDFDRRIMLVDVLGTLDECRFTSNDLPVSKEIARIYYRGSDWHKATEEAKQKDRQHWKEICEVKPQPLPPQLKKAISDVYCACTNEITGREWFKHIPSLSETLKNIKSILNL